MKAAMFHGRLDIRIQEVPIPKPEAGHVLIQVTTAGICGTDAAEFGHGPSIFPIDHRHPVTGQVGGPGTGAAMKLSVNTTVFGLNEAISESLVLAEKAGIERSIAYHVIASSAVAAPVVDYREAVFERPDISPVAFSIDLAGRDPSLVLQLAELVGAKMPQAKVNCDVLSETNAAGFGSADIGQVATHLRAHADRAEI